MQPVRVDDGCYIKLTDKNRGTPVPKGFDAAKQPGHFTRAHWSRGVQELKTVLMQT